MSRVKKYILISQPKKTLFKMRFSHHGGREVTFEQHINLPIKRRDKTVFRQKNSALTFSNALSLFPDENKRFSFNKVKILSEGTEARLKISKESIACCLATRFCLTPKRYGRYKPWKDLLPRPRLITRSQLRRFLHNVMIIDFSYWFSSFQH